MASDGYRDVSIGPVPTLTQDELKKRRVASLQLLKDSKAPEDDAAYIDNKAMLFDHDYKKEVDKIQTEKYGFNPYAGKYEKKDGEWEVKKPTSKLEQFSAGVMRPFEKMVAGGDQPSIMNAYNIPEQSLTTGDKISRGVGELVGYGLEYLPVMKGVKAAGAGTAITNQLVKSQVGKTVGGELVKGGIKNRLKSYVGYKVLGNMVDDGIAGGIVAGIESRGDPTAIATGAALGSLTAPANQYMVKPVVNQAEKLLKPIATRFTGNLHQNIKEGIEELSEQEVKQSITNPSSIATTVGKSIQDTVDDVSAKPTLLLQKEGIKQRGFVKTIKESPNTIPEVADKVQGTYSPISNKQTLDAAKKAIIDSEDDVLTEVLGPSNATADQVAKAQLLIDKYSSEGRHEQAIQVVENIAKKLTSQGQSIQAASMWNRLTPSGILKAAQRTFDKVNATDPNAKLKLSKELASKLGKMAEQIQKMPEGSLTPDGIPDAVMMEKNRATLLMMKEISDQVPVSLAKKIDTVQTMSQLLNPKTITRNILGNTIFGGVDNAQQTLAAGLDKGVSMITGKRSMLVPSPVQQTKGAMYGIKQGYLDAIQGIDTSNVKTQFDLPTGSTFKSGYNPLTYAEKGLNISLRTTDRAFYEAAKRDYIVMAKKLSKINGTKFNLDDAIREADLVAKYRTFQDDTAWSHAFTGVKNALNAGKEFGLGSFVMKYPKTPANLMARAIDYSPVSFIRAMNVLGKTWFKSEGFNQAKFVTDISKGLTGTGLIGMGYYLTDLGIISGAPNNDRDLSAVQRQEGGGKYRVNTTALKRFIDSGFDPNAAKAQKSDTMMSYDWAQPISTTFAIGANMAQGANQPGLDKVGKITESIMGGVDSLYEQPLLSGVAQVFRGGSFASAGETVGRGMLSSFAPTLVSQVNQYKDNAQRDPYDPNFIKYSINLAKSKIPGQAQDLPVSYNVWGEPIKKYQNDSNSALNVFFNPSFVSKYQPTPESQLVIDLYNQTGEKKHAPRVQPRKITAYGFEIEPDAKTLQSMQQYSGQRTRELYKALMGSEEFMGLPDDEKVNVISTKLSRIGADTKLKFFGNTIVEMADKSGDRRKFYQAKKDMVEYLEGEQAKDLYDQITVMSEGERDKYLKTLSEEYPELLEKVGELKVQNIYDKLVDMDTADRIKMLEKMPEEMVKRVTKIRKDDVQKYAGREFTGLGNRFAAEYLHEKISQMPEDQQKPYLQGLLDKGILKVSKKGEPEGIFKELVRLKQGKGPKTDKYLVPQNKYLIPVQ